MKEIRSKITGVTFKNDDGTDRQELIRKYCRPGTNLYLETDPENPHGTHAVKVFAQTPTGLQQVGWVKGGEEAWENLDDQIFHALEANQTIELFVSEITGGSKQKQTLGMNVVYRVYDLGEERQVKPPRKELSPTAKKIQLAIFLAIMICCAAFSLMTILGVFSN